MAHWLYKSEPSAYSWEDLVREGRTEWTGVRNHAAAANLKAMQKGDEGLFYHSQIGLEAVGIVRVSRAAAPDPTGDGHWVSVELEPVRPLPTPVTLKAMKAEPRLAEMPVIRQSRLSVSPIDDGQWAVLMAMAGA